MIMVYSLHIYDMGSKNGFIQRIICSKDKVGGVVVELVLDADYLCCYGGTHIKSTTVSNA